MTRHTCHGCLSLCRQRAQTKQQLISAHRLQGRLHCCQRQCLPAAGALAWHAMHTTVMNRVQTRVKCAEQNAGRACRLQGLAAAVQPVHGAAADPGLPGAAGGGRGAGGGAVQGQRGQHKVQGPGRAAAQRHQGMPSSLHPQSSFGYVGTLSAPRRFELTGILPRALWSASCTYRTA